MVKHSFFVVILCAAPLFAPRLPFTPHVPPLDHGASPATVPVSPPHKPTPIRPTGIQTPPRHVMLMACGLLCVTALVFKATGKKA